MTAIKPRQTNPFQHASFLTSAASLAQCPPDQGLEIAFAGRSNAGKSSAINAICQQGKLAKTSKTPGRTQLLNFFAALSEQQRFVDLPGYGYAKVPQEIKRQWEKFIDEYLRRRQSLTGLVLIMDIRHPLTEFDQSILGWARQANIRLHILLTKADKLKFGPAKAVLLSVRGKLKDLPEVSVQLFSASANTGVEEARERLAAWLAPIET